MVYSNWPSRSCDLTPLDYFLWDYVKSQVYKNNPQSIPELKDEIIRVIGNRVTVMPKCRPKFWQKSGCLWNCKRWSFGRYCLSCLNVIHYTSITNKKFFEINANCVFNLKDSLEWLDIQSLSESLISCMLLYVRYIFRIS